MRTVLHLSPSVRLLGARQSLLQLVTHLDARRWRPVCVLPFEEGGLADVLKAKGIARHTVRMGQWRKAKHWARIPFDLRRLVTIAREEKAALVHCNEPHVAPYGLHIAKKVGIPCVVHLRLDDIDRDLIRKYRLADADRLVAVSEAVARKFEPLWKDWEERIAIVPNGLDAEALMAGAPDREEARRQLHVRDHEFVIGQVGLISQRKRQHVALQAFKAIAPHLPNTRFVIVGSPGKSDALYARSLSAMIEHEGLSGRVHMLPFRADIGSIYAGIDVNLLVSAEEGFGRVIIEAAAFGVPTIGTNVGGIPEVIRDGETGVLVPPDDPEALANAIRRLIADSKRRRALGEAAREDLTRRFTIAHHARAMMTLFDATAGPDRSRDNS